MPLFYREDPNKTFLESFEYSGNWSGTIENVNYPSTFSGFDLNPSQVFTENFESGW